MTNRSLLLLRNQELLIAYSKRIRTIAFTFALKNVEDGKDGLDPEERRSDENTEQIYASADQLCLLLPRMEDSNAWKDFLLSSGILTESNADDILSILGYKDEQKDIFSSPFSPEDLSSSSRNDAYIEFLIRMLSCYRVKARIDSIQEGILEYGVNPFIVPDKDFPYSVLDGIYNRTEEEREKELSLYRKLSNEEEESESEAKKGTLAILTCLKNNKKETKRND